MDEAELQVVGLVREIGEEARNLGKSVARVLSALEKAAYYAADECYCCAVRDGLNQITYIYTRYSEGI